MANNKHTYPDELFDLLPDINADDPHFAVALLAAVQKWRRYFDPDNFSDNADLLRYYTDNTIQVRESFPSTYGEDIQLGEVPHTKSPYEPTYDDVYLLEKCLWNLVAAEREAIARGSEVGATVPNAVDAPQDKPKPVKEPSREAKQAYQLYYGGAGTQADVAETMRKELHRPTITQGDVSRWLKQYKDWLGAQGLPVEGINNNKPGITVNSDILDIGARTDGRLTGDPRHKKNADYGDTDHDR